MKIPFKYLPSSWGLKGRSRARAEAEYYLTGLELDLKLIEIEEDDLDQRAIKSLKAQHRHGQLSEYELDLELAKINLKNSEKDLEIELLNIEYKHHKIERAEFEKQSADLREEPWVSMPNISWDPNNPSRSFFELDYNDYFVEYLKKNNYTGLTDEIIVEKWLNDVCRSVAMDFGQEDPTFVSAATSTTRKTKKSKKKTEYS